MLHLQHEAEAIADRDMKLKLVMNELDRMVPKTILDVVPLPLVRWCVIVFFLLCIWDAFDQKSRASSGRPQDGQQRRNWIRKQLHKLETSGKNRVLVFDVIALIFWSCVGIFDPKEPNFAREFNKSWESYIQHNDVEEALFAIAIYEMLDAPDYAMLLDSLEKSGEYGLHLAFFKVHAAAEMWKGLIRELRLLVHYPSPLE